MSGVPGLFSNLFGELLLEKDCANIEDDPNADPLEKDICRTFRQFSDSLGHFPMHWKEDHGGDPQLGEKPEDVDPESLRDSILKRPERKPQLETPIPRRSSPEFPRHPRGDRDLDKQVEADPSLLDDYLRGEKDKLPDRRSRPRVHSHSSYSSVVITRRPDGVGSLASSPDGSYEERRTVHDSQGNEEVTVTYSDGTTNRDNGPRRGEPREKGDTRPWRGEPREKGGLLDKFTDWFWPKNS